MNRPAYLVLGAGGRLGYAHIGVLQVFDAAGLHFDGVVGSSIGAVIGALYCSGIRGQNLEKLATTIRPRHWMDFRVSRMGLLSGRRLEAVVRLLTQDRPLERMDPPLTVIATDIERGERVIITKGPAGPAVVASSAIPGMFPPIPYLGRRLVDGGILDRLPVAVARAQGAAFVVGVALGTPAKGRRIPVRSAYDVITRSFDIMQWEVSRHSGEPPDVTITPAPADADPDSSKLLENGREAARRALPEILSRMSSQGMATHK